MKVGALLFAVVVLGLSFAVSPMTGAQQTLSQDQDWCEERSDSDRDHYCEVREFTLSPRGALAVDAHPNGGISVTAGSGGQVRVLARVSTWTEEDGGAQALADEVEVVAEGSQVRSDGPRSKNGQGWSVSFRVTAPREIDLDVGSTNGGISVNGIVGELSAQTTNGGIDLRGVGGDVVARTTNGGLHISMADGSWEGGGGLDAQTTNGGITIELPENYRADLEARTTNGGIDTDFSVEVTKGRWGRNQSIQAELNGGGAMLRAVTTNGGIDIVRN